MKIETLAKTVVSYFEKNLVPGMTAAQEVAFYAVAEAVTEEAQSLVASVASNPVLRALVAMDKAGNIDHHKLLRRLRAGLEKKGKLPVTVPLYGAVTFCPEDLDELGAMLEEVSKSENGA